MMSHTLSVWSNLYCAPCHAVSGRVRKRGVWLGESEEASGVGACVFEDIRHTFTHSDVIICLVVGEGIKVLS